MNIWDIVILLIVGGAAALAVLRIRKRKKQGCGGVCGCCDGAGTCGKQPRKEN